MNAITEFDKNVFCHNLVRVFLKLKECQFQFQCW